VTSLPLRANEAKKKVRGLLLASLATPELLVASEAAPKGKRGQATTKRLSLAKQGTCFANGEATMANCSCSEATATTSLFCFYSLITCFASKKATKGCPCEATSCSEATTSKGVASLLAKQARANGFAS
jgi:hypothetical protein